jgi:hypothetical protein
MSTSTMNAASRAPGSAANRTTFDSVAEMRRHRIPEWQLRRVQREIDRYRRMIHPAATAKATVSR